MSITSYSANFEDVMLWRALSHVVNGFYIDIGANHPVEDSVTKLFYENGWSGINIEPILSAYSCLQLGRPRDVNLQCAAGTRYGVTGGQEDDLSASANRGIVQRPCEAYFSKEGGKPQVRSLYEICEEFVKGEINFLKVDSDRFGISAIEEMDLTKFRPWILLVWATRSRDLEDTSAEWEAAIRLKGYCFAYTDGLNRFYVAQEHSELLAALRYPPNALDGYIGIGQLSADIRAEQYRSRAEQAESALAQWQQQTHQWHERILQLHASTSWQITKPLRGGRRLLSGDLLFFERVTLKMKLKIKRTLRPFMAAAIVFVHKRPAWRVKLKRWTVRLPSLHRRLMRVAESTRVLEYAHAPLTVSHNYDFQAMTPRARQIFHNLKAAVEKKSRVSV